MEPKPDVPALAVRVVDTSHAGKALVQFVNAAQFDTYVTLKVLSEWIDDDHGRRERLKNIVEQIPRLPHEDRALVLESAYYW